MTTESTPTVYSGVSLSDGQYIYHEEHEVYIDLPVEEAIERIKEAAEGLANARIQTGGWEDRDYRTNGADIEIVGERPATADEIERYRSAVAKERKKIEEQTHREAVREAEEDERALKRAREAFPDQFKEEA